MGSEQHQLSLDNADTRHVNSPSILRAKNDMPRVIHSFTQIFLAPVVAKAADDPR